MMSPSEQTSVYPVPLPPRLIRPPADVVDACLLYDDRAIETLIMPHVLTAASSDKPVHVVVAAHGIFNSEFIGAFLRRRAVGAGSGWKSTGMTSEFIRGGSLRLRRRTVDVVFTRLLAARD